MNWLQPIPDALVTPESGDPAAIIALRESLRLALVASLRYLPGRQRAVLILRDVLAWPAAEVAEMLDTTTAAVKSTLQRARARLEQGAPAAEEVNEPDEPQLHALLDQYITAFENADAMALKQLLREDAMLEATPIKTWFAGLRTCVSFLTTQDFGAGLRRSVTLAWLRSSVFPRSIRPRLRSRRPRTERSHGMGESLRGHQAAGARDPVRLGSLGYVTPGLFSRLTP